jgi:hypothetical protein
MPVDRERGKPTVVLSDTNTAVAPREKEASFLISM